MSRRVLIAALVMLAATACGSDGTHGDSSGVASTSANTGGGTPAPDASASVTAPVHPGSGATAAVTPARSGAPTLPPATMHASANARITVTTPSAGTFAITGSDCGTSSSNAFFHFGVAGSGEEARIDVSANWHGPGTYGPGTFGVSASVLHMGRAWLVDFQHSTDATLTVDAGSGSGRISYTSQTADREAVSAAFSC